MADKFEHQPTKESKAMDTKILVQLEAVFCQEIDLAGCDLDSSGLLSRFGLAYLLAQ
jgi:hypothetical protein